jgi:hypothetical protein
MLVNRIKICPDLPKLQLWFSRLDNVNLFLKLLRQSTHKMGRFLSTLKHSYPIFIWYTNFRLWLEFAYQIKIGCSCFKYYMGGGVNRGIQIRKKWGYTNISQIRNPNNFLGGIRQSEYLFSPPPPPPPPPPPHGMLSRIIYYVYLFTFSIPIKIRVLAVECYLSCIIAIKK